MTAKNVILVMALIIAGLLFYIALKPNPPIIDQRVLELEYTIDSINKVNVSNGVLLDSLIGEIEVKDLEIADLKKEGEQIDEVYIEKIDSIKFLGVDGNIKLFTELISSKDSF